jgi:hypothetical protein
MNAPLPYVLHDVKVCEACGEAVCAKPGECERWLDNVEDMRRQDREIADYEAAQERKAEERAEWLKEGW